MTITNVVKSMVPDTLLRMFHFKFYCFMPGWPICYLRSGLHQLKPCFIKASTFLVFDKSAFNSTSTQELCHSQHTLFNYVAINLSSISVGWHDHNISSWFKTHTNKTTEIDHFEFTYSIWGYVRIIYICTIWHSTHLKSINMKAGILLC